MDVAIDLGTRQTVVAVRGQGVCLVEPTVVARERDGLRVVAVGLEAERLYGRAPAQIETIRPLHSGVVADYDLAEVFLRHILHHLKGHGLRRPHVMVTVPAGATPSERRLVREAARAAGSGSVELVEDVLAAALGLGLPVERPAGHLVVDLGAGSVNGAVLSLGGTHRRASWRGGGDLLDEAIQGAVRRQFGLAIGLRTAEEVKMRLASVDSEGAKELAPLEVRGRDMASGLPGTALLTAEDLLPSLQEPVAAILHVIRAVLESTSAELSADIATAGIWLTGGLAQLHGLAKLVAEQTGVVVHLAENPLTTIALGALRALEVKAQEDHLVLFPRVV